MFNKVCPRMLTETLFNKDELHNRRTHKVRVGLFDKSYGSRYHLT